MFLLITGASGVGKSTVRQLVAAEFADVLEAAELAEVGGTPEWSLHWRHQAVEQAVQRAIQAQQAGKHFLLCGDPVPPGEVYAAPSAGQLAHVAVCLLDVSPEAQQDRLLRRGDDPTLIPHHIAFATWMRQHVANLQHHPEVITQSGWEQMQWERWLGDDAQEPPWDSTTIDTTDHSPAEVARLVRSWIQQQIGHE